MNMLVTNGFSGENYGAWLNQIMESAPCEWVVFHDHDIYWANRNWYNIIQESIELIPDAGLFTCVTNRIGNSEQKVATDKANNDIKYHMQLALEIEKREPRLIDLTDHRKISGLVMVTNKTAWKASGGFRERSGYIGVDNCYHGRIRKAGYKIYLMNNLYVYHWYRSSIE